MKKLLGRLLGKGVSAVRPTCTAILAAAGSSQRMGGENKLLLPLDGMPVLAYTLRAVDAAQSVDEIVIAAREEDLLTYAELCKTYGIRKPVKVVVGGATRQESVLRAALEARADAKLLAVQDGARPLVTPELFDAVVLRAAVCAAAAPAVPVTRADLAAQNEATVRTVARPAAARPAAPKAAPTAAAPAPVRETPKAAPAPVKDAPKAAPAPVKEAPKAASAEEFDLDSILAEFK